MVEKTTYQTVRESVVEEIAITLKANYRNLAPENAAVPTQGPEGDKEYRRMADELIDQGQFRLYDSEQTISKKGVTSKINNFSKLVDDKPKLQAVLGKAKLIADIPDKDDLKAISTAIDKGAKKSTASFSDFSFSGLLSMISNFIAALVDWVAGGFKKNFWEHVGEHAGNSAAQSVRGELNNLRAKDAGIRGILNEERLNAIEQTVKHKALETSVGHTIEKPNTTATLASIEVGERNDFLNQDKLKSLVDNQIEHTINDVYFAQEDDPNTPNVVEGSAREAVKKATVYDSSADDVQAAFLKATQEVVHDKDTGTMTADDIRNTLATKVTDALDWDSRRSPIKVWDSTNGEAAVRESIVKGEDGESLLDGAAINKIQQSSIIYNEGVKLTDGQSVAPDAPSIASNHESQAGRGS